MPRLHLKRTPAEEERHARRKARKSPHKDKEKRSRRSDYNEDDSHFRHKRHRSRSRSPRRGSSYRSRRYHNEVPSPDDPGPSSYARSNDYDDSDYDHLEDEAARARMEQERFEEKMRDALEDDGLYDPMQRLDGVEARLNSYSHIPRRWRGTDEGFSAGLWMEDAREDIGLEPWQMNDDEYSEYIRAGMWRKKNHAEFEERLRKKEERKARKEREQRLREETRRLEREAHAEREMLSAAKARRRLEEARRLYEERWTALLSRPAEDAPTEDRVPLYFDDIPWPIGLPAKRSTRLDVDEFTKEAVSSFLLRSEKERTVAGDAMSSTKDVLRATMLRFHPDKFEARVLARVRERDRELVKDVANMVVRILNELLKEHRE